MTRAAEVPAQTDFLCEACGYVLTGISDDGRCPECGKPRSDSLPSLRTAPAWERPGNPVVRFARTAIHCIARPRRFFRNLSIYGDRSSSGYFALWTRLLSAALFGVAAWGHLNWFAWLDSIGRWTDSWHEPILLTALAWLLIELITHITARLTAFEAAYRGLRLPLPVVRRALDYHAAHLLPVALMVLASVVAWHIIVQSDPNIGIHISVFLYVLCGEVVVAGLYLFKTYWTAMRNLMYANRAV